MRNLNVLLTILLALSVRTNIEAQSSNCPGKRGLVHLKEAIDSSGFKYDVGAYRFATYQIILEAACAGQLKDKELERKRVGIMWQQLSLEPVSTDSTLRLRNLLHYAISKRNQPIMLATATRWDVDLNEPDGNGQLLLDFLSEEITNAPDSNTAGMLKEYYEIYQRKGAVKWEQISFIIRNLMKRYEAVRHYAYGLYAVQKKNKWGWVNPKGEVVVPLQYKAVRSYLPDLFEVSNDGVHYFFVNRKNQRTFGPWN